VVAEKRDGGHFFAFMVGPILPCPGIFDPSQVWAVDRLTGEIYEEWVFVREADIVAYKEGHLTYNLPQFRQPILDYKFLFSLVPGKKTKGTNNKKKAPAVAPRIPPECTSSLIYKIVQAQSDFLPFNRVEQAYLRSLTPFVIRKNHPDYSRLAASRDESKDWHKIRQMMADNREDYYKKLKSRAGNARFADAHHYFHKRHHHDINVYITH